MTSRMVSQTMERDSIGKTPEGRLWATVLLSAMEDVREVLHLATEWHELKAMRDAKALDRAGTPEQHAARAALRKKYDAERLIEARRRLGSASSFFFGHPGSRFHWICDALGYERQAFLEKIGPLIRAAEQALCELEA